MAEPPRTAGESPEGLGRETIRRVSWRLLPFLMLAYLVCYIDRTNAGFAALQMNKAVGISAGVFGLGGGTSSSPIACSRCPATSPWSGSGRGAGSRAS